MALGPAGPVRLAAGGGHLTAQPGYYVLPIILRLCMLQRQTGDIIQDEHGGTLEIGAEIHKTTPMSQRHVKSPNVTWTGTKTALKTPAAVPSKWTANVPLALKAPLALQYSSFLSMRPASIAPVQMCMMSVSIAMRTL